MATESIRFWESLDQDEANQLGATLEEARTYPGMRHEALKAFVLKAITRDPNLIAEVIQEEMPWLLDPEGDREIEQLFSDPTFTPELEENLRQLLSSE